MVILKDFNRDAYKGTICTIKLITALVEEGVNEYLIKIKAQFKVKKHASGKETESFGRLDHIMS